VSPLYLGPADLGTPAADQSILLGGALEGIAIGCVGDDTALCCALPAGEEVTLTVRSIPEASVAGVEVTSACR
jgi:hypothetical protein